MVSVHQHAEYPFMAYTDKLNQLRLAQDNTDLVLVTTTTEKKAQPDGTISTTTEYKWIFTHKAVMAAASVYIQQLLDQLFISNDTIYIDLTKTPPPKGIDPNVINTVLKRSEHRAAMGNYYIMLALVEFVYTNKAEKGSLMFRLLTDRFVCEGYILIVVAQMLGLSQVFHFFINNAQRFINANNMFFMERKFSSHPKITNLINALKIANSITPAIVTINTSHLDNHTMFVVSMKANPFTFVLVDPLYNVTFILELPQVVWAKEVSIKAMSISTKNQILVSMNNWQMNKKVTYLYDPVTGSYTTPVPEHRESHFISIGGALVDVMHTWNTKGEMGIKLAVYQMFTIEFFEPKFVPSNWEREWIHFKIAQASSQMIYFIAITRSRIGVFIIEPISHWPFNIEDGPDCNDNICVELYFWFTNPNDDDNEEVTKDDALASRHFLDERGLLFIHLKNTWYKFTPDTYGDANTHEVLPHIAPQMEIYEHSFSTNAYTGSHGLLHTCGNDCGAGTHLKTLNIEDGTVSTCMYIGDLKLCAAIESLPIYDSSTAMLIKCARETSANMPPKGRLQQVPKKPDIKELMANSLIKCSGVH